MWPDHGHTHDLQAGRSPCLAACPRGMDCKKDQIGGTPGRVQEAVHQKISSAYRSFSRNLITRMTVQDNILLSFQNQAGEHLKNTFLFPMQVRKQERRNREKAKELLAFMGIEEKANDLVEDLSYGQQKMISLACCLASGADLLLLDEPVAGINPELIEKILKVIKKLQKAGKTFVLIEHNIEAVMQVCDRVIFMDEGKKIAEGDPESVRHDPAVIDAYLE